MIRGLEVQTVFGSGWDALTLKFSDDTTESVQVEKTVYDAVVNKHDRATMQSIKDGYSEAYGGRNIVAFVVKKKPNENRTGDERVDSNKTTHEPCSVGIEERSICPLDINNNETPNSTQESNSVGSEESSFSAAGSLWSHEAVLLLMATYADHKEKFSSSCFKQKDVWEMIAKNLRSKGYKVNGADCSDKFRGMKFRYKKIKDSNEKSGRGRRNWNYFDALEELFSGDPAVTPVRVVASAASDQYSKSTTTPVRSPQPSTSPTSMITGTTTAVVNTSGDKTDNSRPVTHAGGITNKRRKKDKAPEWFTTYVEENNRRLDRLIQSNDQMVQIASQRNNILSRLADSFEKQQ